ncbi:MAG: M28 family peptidase [Acidobacteriota bacterium]
MNRGIIIAAAALIAIVRADAQPITGEEIMKHTAILADDKMEGRGTGSKGERLAADYIAEQFKAIGLLPGNSGSYIQGVPLIGMTADQSMTVAFQKGSEVITARYYDEIVGGSGVVSPSVNLDGELVFVGYGISAPEQKWDDYKDVDVRGKVLLMLVNDPPSTDEKFFGGRAMTYYGRWTYKYEEAGRKGAAGAILIHIEDTAGYPWQVPQQSWSGERFLPEQEQDPLKLRAWLRGDVAERVVGMAGKDLQTLVASAASPDFKPVPLHVTVKATFENQIRHLSAPNAIGMLPGAVTKERYVVVSAHHDHFGIGKPDATGDAIYNGAHDNAVGVATLLACARALAIVHPKDSVLFLTYTGEEQNLLGSEYYVHHPVVPLDRTIAVVNVDGGNSRGRTLDARAQGAEKSDLDAIVAEAAKSAGMKISPDPFPEKGYYFRSDHFSFARAGVPGFTLSSGLEYEGRPAGWGESVAVEYIRTQYHQPSDEVDDTWDLSGQVQVAELVVRIVERIAERKGEIRWNEDCEFQRP